MLINRIADDRRKKGKNMKTAGSILNRAAAVFLAVPMVLGLLPAFSGSVYAADYSYCVIEDPEAFADAEALEEAGILILDASVFLLSNAEMTGIGEGYSWKYDPEGTVDGGSASHGIIYWDDYSGAKKQSGGTYILNTDSGFSLKWEGAAQTLGGAELDVELTVSEAAIEYIGTDETVSEDIPSSQCVVMYDTENSSDSSLCICAYPIEDGALCFAADCTMNISFYYAGTSDLCGSSYLFYASDVDGPDYLEVYADWIEEGCPDLDGDSLYEYYSEINGSEVYYSGEYTETFTFNAAEGTGSIYLWEDSYLSVNAATGEISASCLDDNTKQSAFEVCLEGQNASMGWKGSNCASSLFGSYCTMKLYLIEDGEDELGNDASLICDVSGALFKVSSESGTVVGYFITEDGMGYAAGTEETSLSYSVEYEGVTYYRTSRKYLALAPGNYTVTQLAAPEGYTLAEDVTVALSSETAKGTAYVANSLDKYPVVLRKYTSDTYNSDSGSENYFINGENGYSLLYAGYAIYVDEDCTELAATVQTSAGAYTTSFVTTSASSDSSYLSSAVGSSYVLYMEPGIYYLKEISPSSGYLATNSEEEGYALQIRIVPEEAGVYQYFNVYEDIDTLDLSLQKTDDSGNDLEEEGMEFSLVYEYTDVSGAKEEISLTYETDSYGYINFADADYITSGCPFTDKDGNVIFGAGTITLAETSGTVGYKANSEEIVIKLTLDDEGNLLSAVESENITIDLYGNFKWVNEEMTINSELTDDSTQSHFSSGNALSLTDTVAYDNFYEGEVYTLKAWLYDVTQEGLAKDDSGDYIYAEISFETSSDSGSAELEFSFSAEGLAGHTLVSYVYVYDEDGTFILRQAEVNNADASVYITGLTTSIADAENGSHVSMADDSVTLSDTISYENLPDGAYALEGCLYDITVGDFAKDDEGNLITASAYMEVSGGINSGSLTLDYAFEAEGLSGHVLSAYVYVYDASGDLWTEEADPENGEQTIYFPSIDTVLTGTDRETKVFKTNDALKLVDTVTLTSLKADNTRYKLVLTLVSKEDESAAVDFTNGGSSTFYKDSAEEETVNVTASFETKGLNGEYVAYEELYVQYGGEWHLVASHKDLEDEDQTVEIISTANLLVYKMDSETGNLISGAVYELYTSEDEFVCEVEIGEDGVSELIEDLYFGNYYLIETKAADGYFVNSEKTEFAITEEQGGTTVEIAVTDAGLEVLPDTGSSGLWPIILLSLILALSGMFFVWPEISKGRSEQGKKP